MTPRAPRPRLSDRRLGRATLARQGLLERHPGDVVEVVEQVGAIQSQQWSAVAVSLAARSAKSSADELYAALADGALVTGTLLRRTLHLCSRADHPAYALVADTVGANRWWRTDPAPGRAADALRRDLLSYVASLTRTVEETSAFIESWLDERPGMLTDAEIQAQQAYGWRPYRSGSDFLRAPANGTWGPRTPSGFLAAPQPPSLTRRPDRDEALAQVVRRHLRAFGPAGAEDIAAWTGAGVAAVRTVLNGHRRELVTYEAQDGRRLHDLRGLPLPDEDTPAPPRLLPWFDGILLGFAPTRRSRVLDDEHRSAVYLRANLQVRPTFLVDGRIAGTWSVHVAARESVLTLEPFRRLPRRTLGEVVAEAEPVVRVLAPASRSHGVAVAAP
jgi:Winged helix DNA-binding domain